MADSTRKTTKRQSETPEQREERLKRRRILDKRRRESETPEKRRARLDRQKAYRERRKASECDLAALWSSLSVDSLCC